MAPAYQSINSLLESENQAYMKHEDYETNLYENA